MNNSYSEKRLSWRKTNIAARYKTNLVLVSLRKTILYLCMRPKKTCSLFVFLPGSSIKFFCLAIWYLDGANIRLSCLLQKPMFLRHYLHYSSYFFLGRYNKHMTKSCHGQFQWLHERAPLYEHVFLESGGRFHRSWLQNFGPQEWYEFGSKRYELASSLLAGPVNKIGGLCNLFGRDWMNGKLQAFTTIVSSRQRSTWFTHDLPLHE